MLANLRKTLFMVAAHCCATFFLCVVVNVGFAQSTVKFQHITDEDGLSHPSVTSILKDRYGFLWFGTRDGLNRYDSYGIVQYKYQTNDSTSISNNTISCLYEDHTGILWVGTEGGGLNAYNPITNTFRRFAHVPERSDGIPHNVIGGISEDSKGNIWVATMGGGLSHYDRTTGLFTTYRHDPDDASSIGSDMVMSVIVGSGGKIWLATEGSGLVRFDPETEEFKNYPHDPDDPSSISTDLISTLFEDKDGQIWIGSWGFGMNVFDKENEEFRRIIAIKGDRKGMPNNNIFAICQDNHGRMWFGTRDGLTRYDPLTNKYVTYNIIEGNEFSLGDNVAFSLYYDESNQIVWVGTWGFGVAMLDQYGSQVQNFQHVPDDPNSLNDNDVFAFYEDKAGNLWIGTEGGGLNIYNPTKQEFQNFSYNANNPASAGADEVMSIYEDRLGQIWIGTSGGLKQFDPQTKLFKDFSGNNSIDNIRRLILSIYGDSKGKIWFSTSLEGVFQLDPSTGAYTHYKEHPFPDKVIYNEVLCMYEDHTGAMWFGSRNSGLAMLDRDTGTFTYFKNNPANEESIGANGIYALHEDAQHRLWIGTRGSGLNMIQLPLEGEPKFRRITTSDGLVGDWILGIQEDDNGNIWASGQGMSVISNDLKQIKSFTFSSANQGAFYRSERTGHFYLGGKGFDVFHPDSIEIWSAEPPLLISNLQRFNTKEQSGAAIPVPGVYAQDSLQFTYDDQILAFEFLSLDYASQTERQYAYFLESFNEDWIRMGTERKITFTGLSSGDYLLKVKSVRPTGELSMKEAQFAFTVLPPWWRTKLANGIYTIFILSGLYFVYYWRTQEQRRKIRQKEIELRHERKVNDRLKQVDKLKDQFLANTSHELRTPLQGIIGLSESLTAIELDPKKKRDLTMITASGKRLSNLVNSILDFSKLKTQEIDLSVKPVDLRTVTDAVLHICKPLVKGKPVALYNEIDRPSPFVEADEDRVYQILHNLIGNAIKFTVQGKIKVKAKANDELIEICVEDSGIGIPEDKQETIFNSFEQVSESNIREQGGTGLGLTITRQLVELQGGTIWLESEPQNGTKVYFTLPKSSHEQHDLLSKVDSSTFGIEDRLNEVLEVFDSGNFSTGDKFKFNILVVDDEPVNQQVLSNHLMDDQFKIRQAHDGEEALEMIEKSKPDLILLDVMMPKMSGYEVCKEVRKEYMASELPIIMITAKDQVHDLVEGLASGANDYLAKPFSKDELLARLRTHLNLYHINSAYLRFIPKEFLKALGHESIVDVSLGDQVQGDMTILFCDIRSFTTITEKLTAKESFEFLNQFLESVTPAIKENGGFIDKYIGDAIMALFPKNPDDAIKSAIGIRKRLQEFNKTRDQNGLSAINIGIGVHTGPLMLGTIGVKDRMDGTVISDAVNLASRLESLNKLYGTSIIVSEGTVDKLEKADDYQHRFLSYTRVKGKEKAIRIYDFFDGDVDEFKAKKLETLGLFNEGIKDYYARNFTKASVKFQAVIDQYPEDQTAKLFLEKSAQNMLNGVTEDWDGVDVLDRVI